MYRELLDYCWQNGSLPRDEKHLSKIADCTVSQLRKHWQTFGKMFILNGERYENEKVNAARPGLVRWRNAKRLGGRKGAETRAKQAKEKATIVQTTVATDADKVELQPSSPSPSSSTSTTASLRAAVVVTRTTAAPGFEPFDDGPDPEALVSAAVEAVAQFWPRLGNVPLAKMCWQMEALRDVHGVAEWCQRVVATAQVHAKAHREAQSMNRRHFIPDLCRWVKDGDYAQKPPETAPAEQRRRFDPSSLEEPA